MDQLKGFYGFDSAWNEFKRRHGDWLTDRLNEDDVVYRLPARVLDTLQCDLALTDRNVLAEAAFDELCLRHRAVAVCDGFPISYRWLLPPISAFPKSQLTPMLKLGWTEAQTKKVPQLVRMMDDVSKRVKSIAGRRVCDPEFLADRDRLRLQWTSIRDIRPPQLPLWRTQQIPDRVRRLRMRLAAKTTVPFLQDFDDFCDKWRLFGMTTWDLPYPLGPNWPEIASNRERPDASLVLTTPIDFPLLRSDRVGQLAIEQHEQSARERGVSDLRRWQTYAHFLEIDHWERVLRLRYREGQRPRNFVTLLEATIAQLVHLDDARIQHYRKELRSLKAGRRRSLARHR
jgi:hypothetical protein